MMTVLPLLASLALAAPPVPVPDAVAAAAVRAIVAAVQLRMGADVEVLVDAVTEISLPGGTLTDAVAAPGAKLGAATRFVLRGPAAPPADQERLLPLGSAVVSLRVIVDHAHTARPVRRGVALDQGDLTRVRHVFTAGAMKRLPSLDEAVHGRVLQDLAADACLTGQTFTAVPAVRAGADVVAIVRTGGIEARADLVSVDSGNPGDMVRVTNPQSRRTFRARVVARDLVEISHE